MKQILSKRIEINSKIMAGKPIIKGTRIPIYLIVKLLAQGITPKEILEDYPELKKEDIMAALEYVSELLNKEEIFSATE